MSPDPAIAPDAAEILPFGHDALIVRFSLRFSEAAAAAAQALAARLDASPPEGVTEIAPSLVTVLIRFDPSRTTRAAMAEAVRPQIRTGAAPMPPPRRRWTIPVAFGGAAGPELAEAAGLAGLTEAQAIAQVTAAELRVLAIGFAPGQPYIGLLPGGWEMPRRPELNPRVPAGAIVTAIRQIVLFSGESATGWRHIGQSAFRPFLPGRAEPFALAPGDAIRLAHVPEIAPTDDGLGGARLERLA